MLGRHQPRHQLVPPFPLLESPIPGGAGCTRCGCSTTIRLRISKGLSSATSCSGSRRSISRKGMLAFLAAAMCSARLTLFPLSLRSFATMQCALRMRFVRRTTWPKPATKEQRTSGVHTAARSTANSTQCALRMRFVRRTTWPKPATKEQHTSGGHTAAKSTANSMQCALRMRFVRRTTWPKPAAHGSMAVGSCTAQTFLTLQWVTLQHHYPSPWPKDSTPGGFKHSRQRFVRDAGVGSVVTTNQCCTCR